MSKSRVKKFREAWEDDEFNDMLENKISEGVRLDILLVYKYLKKSFF